MLVRRKAITSHESKFSVPMSLLLYQTYEDHSFKDIFDNGGGDPCLTCQSQCQCQSRKEVLGWDLVTVTYSSNHPVRTHGLSVGRSHPKTDHSHQDKKSFIIGNKWLVRNTLKWFFTLREEGNQNHDRQMPPHANQYGKACLFHSSQLIFNRWLIIIALLSCLTDPFLQRKNKF